MLLTISYSELANPITTQYQLKARFWDTFEISINFVYYIFMRMYCRGSFGRAPPNLIGLRIIDHYIKFGGGAPPNREDPSKIKDKNFHLGGPLQMNPYMYDMKFTCDKLKSVISDSEYWITCNHVY